MKLKDFLFHAKKTRKKFMKESGLNRRTLCNVLAGKDMTLSVAIKIEDATQGIVTCRELFDDEKHLLRQQEKLQKKLAKKKELLPTN
jgi:hypothetical protein